jgi:hypothetical protein
MKVCNLWHKVSAASLHMRRLANECDTGETIYRNLRKELRFLPQRKRRRQRPRGQAPAHPAAGSLTWPFAPKGKKR